MQIKALHLFAAQPKAPQHAVFRLVGRAAMGADFAHQPLRQNSADGRSDQRGFDLHVDQADERADRIFCMKRRKDFMPRERRLHRHVR